MRDNGSAESNLTDDLEFVKIESGRLSEAGFRFEVAHDYVDSLWRAGYSQEETRRIVTWCMGNGVLVPLLALQIPRSAPSIS